MGNITRTISNLDDAFDVIFAETRDKFHGVELCYLSDDQKREAVLFMKSVGILNLRESVNRIAAEMGRSRVWVYNVIREADFMLDLSRRSREETLK